MEMTKQQLQISSWLGIFRSHREESEIKKEFETLSVLGKINPFGASFQEDVRALVLNGKPIADIDYGIYIDEKVVCDFIINIYGVEKLEDPIKRTLWLFRSEKREDALRRITELNHVLNSETRTLDDFKKIGELYGYSEDDINKFVLWKKFLIMKSQKMAKGEA